MEIRSHSELLPELERRWERLACDLGAVTPFQTPEWLRAYVASFCPKEVTVFEFLEAGRTVAIVPVMPAVARRYFRQQNWLEFAGARYADYATFLCAPTHEDEIARLLVRSVQGSECDGLYLGSFRRGEAFLNALSAAMTEHGWHARLRNSSSVRVLTREIYQSQSQSGARWSSDKLLKKLEKKGKLEFQVHTDFSSVASLLPRFFQMHLARFGSRGMHSMFEDPRQQQFFVELARAFAGGGNLWLSLLRCGDRPVAMRFSLRGGDRLHLYSTCFDDEFANFSPSSHQLRFLLEHSFQSGIKVVDLGIGASPHKELPGTEPGDELMILEAYRSKFGVLESATFDAIQRCKARSTLIEKIGKRVRKLLPHTA